ncbi:PAS domain S-box protein [Streptomyces sp. NBC_00271]|uniref:PAS domain S-box protein n=1 Tax=Streptomyces sp. NBC_00271 TaxID=2975697 RepID=UPI002E29933F|nr:PAS domain S-box protein [Streptomyces sp. NBC_00271]
MDAVDAVVWRNRAMTLFDRIPMPVAVCDVYGAVILANPAMAAEWGATSSGLRGRKVLDLFRPQEPWQIERIAQALRLRRRSRYPVSVRWDAADGVRREGELTADPVSDSVEASTALLVMVRVLGECPVVEQSPEPAAGTAEIRILTLLAGGATTARAARETGLTVDGVNYHLRRLSERWGAANRTELVARAYALGVLTPGVWPPAAVPAP